MTVRGWAHGSPYGSEDEKKKANENRKIREKEGLTRLEEQMKPLLDGFEIRIAPHDLMESVEVKLKGVSRRAAAVFFRYSGSGFHRGYCEGVSAKCEGEWDAIRSLGRSYSYDFEQGCMKPASLKKMCDAISAHLRSVAEHRAKKKKRGSDSKQLAEKAAGLLRAEGFEVKLGGDYTDDMRFAVQDVVVLKARGDGVICSTGRGESVPIWTEIENIVAVVKAIRALNVAMGGSEEQLCSKT